KRIFRYLKGQPKLGPGKCKKQTVVANSTTEAEYVAASSCCGQVQALVDKTKVIITEERIRSDLHFDDAEGTACLLNEEIFEGLARMGAKTTAWNEFSNTMASAIICLADNQKFNFSKYIFDNMINKLKEWQGIRRCVISSHTKKIFANMRRIGAGFSRVITPLFDSMMVQAAIDMGDIPVETHQTPIVDQPSTFKPQKPQNPRRKQRKEAKTSHDESEDEDYVPTPFSDPLPSGEDNSILNELMVFCISLQEYVLELQEAKAAQAKEIEDASKQGRMIEEIDHNAEIVLDVETQGRTNDDEMFRVDDLAIEEVVMETTTGIKDSASPTTDVTKDEITMAQALVALKSAKVVVQEQEMSTTIPAAATIVTTVVLTPRAKGKAKMIETEVPLKKKEQMRIDEEYARKIQAEEQEAARLSRAQQDEEANNSWDNMQAMMDVDRLLAERLQARERKEFSNVQKARLLAELIEKRKKHFDALRALEKRSKPPTKTQMKRQMSTYLRHMGVYKQSHLKGRSFDEIKELFDKEMRNVNDFVAMDSEAQKRIVDDSEELRKCIEIVPDDGDEVLIEATPISSRSPTIINYKIHNEGKKTYFKIIIIDGNSQAYQTFEKMFKNFNREDLEVLWAIVKERFKKEKLVDDMDNILFRTIKTMFEHHVEDTIWNYQQGLAKVKNWKLFESYGVYYITMQSIIYYLMVEKVYPLTRNALH
nr:hypothetical protein [Tanacetum cinerariifolium]